MPRSLSPALAIATLLLLTFASTGCIETDLARQIVDKFVPEEEVRYERESLLPPTIGAFAPETDQDRTFDDWMEIIGDLIEDPTKAPEVFENVSWQHYDHPFTVPENARGLVVVVNVDWQLLNGPNYIGGDVTVVLTDPNGNVCGDCSRHEMKLPDYTGQEVQDPLIQIIDSHPIPGRWNLDVSGTGLDGAANIIYKGTYTVTATAKVKVSG